jgi:hypothetical protein
VLQSGDKALLFGAGGRENRFPIVFHLQNDPVIAIVVFSKAYLV